MATISKTSTFQVHKIFSDFFSPSFGWVLPVACLRPRLLRRNTAALRSPRRPRFRGPAAPGGEGGRGCEEQKGPWPRRRILVGQSHEALGFRCEEVNEDVDGSLMVPLFGEYCFICLESVPKHLHQCLVLLFVSTTILFLHFGSEFS